MSSKEEFHEMDLSKLLSKETASTPNPNPIPIASHPIPSHPILACEAPRVPVNASSLMAKYKPEPEVDCGVEPDWVYVDSGRAYFRSDLATSHPGFTCRLTPISRNTDFNVNLGPEIELKENGTTLPADGTFVDCGDKNGKKFKTLLDSVVRKPDKAEAIKSRLLKTGSELPRATPNALPLSVIMIGQDSMSKNAWRRYVPKTYNYFVDSLGGLVLEGYNIVGDGTPQALLPILTGLAEYELPEARRSKKGAKPVDGHPWIWKDFAAKGYSTMWIEDEPGIGTFTYRMLGFKDPPTDYYGRVQWLARQKHAQTRITSQNTKCDSGQHRHLTAILNPVREHLQVFPDLPTFSFSFGAENSHGDNNHISTQDKHTEAFLQKLDREGRLDNALLILMSDHGARFANRDSEEGKIEERKPMFGFRFPKWFVEQHPSKMAALRLNAKERLVTPFDIHATFHHLLDIQKDKYEIPHHKKEKGIRAISLLQEIPASRTCAQADIEPHWCACMNWREIPLDSSSGDNEHGAGIVSWITSLTHSLTHSSFSSSSSATSPTSLCKTAVEYLNGLTSSVRSMCASLSVKEVLKVSVMETPVEMRRFKKTIDADGFVPELSDKTGRTFAVFMLKFRTSPNEGMYEMTIKLRNGKLEFDERAISRTNKYGDQPKCVRDKMPHLRKYCYCV